MPSEQAILLATATAPSYLVAPAGYGKTEAIADAVALASSPQLVLTHTHAGVHSLRKRLQKKRVPSAKYRIHTLDGWALRYVAAYPSMSGVSQPSATDLIDWCAVRKGMARLLSATSIRTVITAAFGGVLVDEYQDCSPTQHDIVMRLTNLLPCRIVGDPLQGIFGFGEEGIVEWESEIYPHFQPLPPLDHPYRWDNGNRALGEWLRNIRPLLAAGRAIPLTGAPVKRFANDRQGQYGACIQSSLLKPRQSVVAIRKMPHEAHELAKHLGNRYSSIDEMEGKDLMKWARKIESTSGPERALVTIDFAAACMTVVKPKLNTVVRRLEDAKVEGLEKLKPERVTAALKLICTDADLSHVANGLQAMAELPDKKTVYRKELLLEMRRALRSVQYGGHSSLTDAAWQIRDRTRQHGRMAGSRFVARTLLVKGLEFDHAVAMDLEKMEAPEIYVALSRATQSLTIVHDGELLVPKRSRRTTTAISTGEQRSLFELDLTNES